MNFGTYGPLSVYLYLCHIYYPATNYRTLPQIVLCLFSVVYVILNMTILFHPLNGALLKLSIVSFFPQSRKYGKIYA